MKESKFLAGVGARIRELRLNNDMTQNYLAVQCDFEKANMSRLEAGKMNLTILTLHKISKALEVDMSELFNKDGQDGK
jgi:transcriptional regulator with XRE-family HTH domain